MLSTDRKPKVYIETTVVSYLAARLSRNTTIAARQQATRQFWYEHAHRFVLVIFPTVISEIRRDNTEVVQHRLNFVSDIKRLPMSDIISNLMQNLLVLCHAKVDRYKDREHSSLLQQERHKASKNQIIYSSFGT